MQKKNIVVAGLGLIGGSLAKGMFLDHYIIGYDVDENSLEYALNNDIIDEIATSFADACQKADIIFLASPISSTIQLLEELDAMTFEKDIIVTDACSVKGSVLNTANQLKNNHIVFIGGHPMAGSHKKGIQAAKAHLFENAIYVLTPTTKKSTNELETVKEVLRNTKSNFIVLTPEEHDEMTGVISHFPHLVASSLVHQAKNWQKRHPYLPELAAGGFRDITRIASSNPYLWQDIFAHNQGKMSVLLGDWIEEMTKLKEMIEQNHKQDLTNYLQQAKDYRDGLGERKRGALPSFYDVYVDIRDQTGAFARVAKILADSEISITNIRIVEIREGIMGALRLSLSSKNNQDATIEVLTKNGYEVTIEN